MIVCASLLMDVVFPIKFKCHKIGNRTIPIFIILKKNVLIGVFVMIPSYIINLQQHGLKPSWDLCKVSLKCKTLSVQSLLRSKGTQKKTKMYFIYILADTPIKMYIPNDDAQNYPFCILQLLVETF